jgi:glycosyltransferase involved in cell wall biosynthesis
MRLGRPQTVLEELAAEVVSRGRRPLILHVIDGVGVGGSQKLIFDLIRGLGAQWDMEVLSRASASGLRFGDVPIHVARDDEAMTRVLRRDIGRRPVLIHLHYWGRSAWMDAVLGALVEAFPGVPVIENMNSPAPVWEDPAIGYHVYVSEYLRGLSPTRGPSSVIYPGVDVEAYRPARLGLRPAPVETVGLVYRLENDKLAPDTIDMLIALVRIRPSARIVLIGEGSHYRHYAAQARAAGVRGRFWFAGLVPFDELPAWYRRFTVFCAPVHTESYGLVVPYAMAMEIAVCGYRVGALEEILGRTDGLVETPQALAALAARLLADDSRREALARGGRQRVIERMSLSAMLKAYRELYTRLIAASSGQVVAPS